MGTKLSGLRTAPYKRWFDWTQDTQKPSSQQGAGWFPMDIIQKVYSGNIPGASRLTWRHWLSSSNSSSERLSPTGRRLHPKSCKTTCRTRCCRTSKIFGYCRQGSNRPRPRDIRIFRIRTCRVTPILCPWPRTDFSSDLSSQPRSMACRLAKPSARSFPEFFRQIFERVMRFEPSSST